MIFSENARKSDTYLRHTTRSALLACTSLLALSTGTAHADSPRGGRVVTGNAEIHHSDGTTTVNQSSNRAVIDWRSFDVGRDNHVVFDQPGRDSATLNRVHSGHASAIDGAITAPGTVIIQNTAGVIFSGTARLDVGGLVATSQQVDASHFDRTGNYRIGGGELSGAEVVNEGRITVGEAGLAALVGRDVKNHGAIVARRGTVALASGTRTTIDLSGDGTFQIATSGRSADGGVEHTGSINASEGTVLITAGGISGALNSAINTSGVIRATSSSGQGGTIRLEGRGNGTVRIGGTVSAGGATTGGNVDITGQSVHLTSDARVNVRGGQDGGTARIGGGLRGAGDLAEADTVTIDNGARINATGTTGDGGTVVAWSGDGTWFDGIIRAGGGTTGGFIETSGKYQLGIGVHADVSAGPGGQWLLDPRDVIITDGGSDASGGVNNPTDGDGPWFVDAEALENTLAGGTDVTINTDATGTIAGDPGAQQAGDITIAEQIRWEGLGSLTLSADRDVVANDRVAPEFGSLTLEAGRDIVVNERLQSRDNGNITLTADRDITINENVRTLDEGILSMTATTGDVLIGDNGSSSTIVSTVEGPLFINAPNGSVVAGANAAAERATNIQVYARRGNAEITAGDAIRIEGGVANNQWVRVGRSSSSGETSLTAPTVQIVGGTGSNSSAELQVGRDGHLSVDADFILLSNAGEPENAEISALRGGSLTLRAQNQIWDGEVRSGTGADNGGEVNLEGHISALVQPTFSLDEDASFTLSGDSSYTGTAPLSVSTTLSGTIDISGPVVAPEISLLAEEMVALRTGTQLMGTNPGDSVVVAAGRRFINESGPEALLTVDPNSRWLLYMDEFDGMEGTEPGPREFDIYGRPFATNPPFSINLGGNRIIYGEQPVLTLTADSFTKPYGNEVEATWSVSGLRPGDSLDSVLAAGPDTYSEGTDADAPVGSYVSDIEATPSNRGYLVTLVDGVITVDPATLTVTANDATRLYGAPNPEFTAEITGFVNGEDAGDLTGDITLTTQAAETSDVGTYAITPQAEPESNYIFSFVDGTLTVTPADLTITANEASRTYGAANPALTADFDGLVAGDSATDLDGSLTVTTAADASADAGEYGITASGITDGNYHITYVDGTLAVTPADLTITADNANRTYGANNPEFTAAMSGFVNGDTADDLAGDLAFATSASSGSSVGDYGVSPSGLASGNYDITWVDGTLTVNPAELTVSVDDAVRNAGRTNPEFTASFSGFAAGDDASDLDGTLVMTTEANATSPAGDYTISGSGLASSNYGVTYVDGSLTVLPAAPPDAEGATSTTETTRALQHGAEPLTPGDASFRTTEIDAPPAASDTFGLSYSLGEIVQLAPEGAAPGAPAAPTAPNAATEGFVPASGTAADDTEGFVPASGEAQSSGEPAEIDGTCSGAISRGAATDANCARRTVPESYWTTSGGGFN